MSISETNNALLVCLRFVHLAALLSHFSEVIKVSIKDLGIAIHITEGIGHHNSSKAAYAIHAFMNIIFKPSEWIIFTFSIY